MNNDNKIVGWHHEHRGGVLKKEVDDSEFFYRLTLFRIYFLLELVAILWMIFSN